MSTFELLGSRRLTGPNLFSDRPGAVIDVSTAQPSAADNLGEAWKLEARRLLVAAGWEREQVRVRVFRGGVSLVLSAPIDALYAACELNEVAYAAAVRRVQTSAFPADFADVPDSPESVGQAPTLPADEIETLRSTIAAEANPRLLRLQRAAEERGVAFLSDDDLASVGLGCGSRTWPVGELPDPSQVDWDEVRDIPLLLVTGTNGKTTTVRLLASMVRAAGLVPGTTSTDGIMIGEEMVDAGDWSGPGGARTVTRDRRVQLVILEAARGGLLRRGLGVRHADAAAVTNVAEDHMGEFGVQSLIELADVKLVVSRALSSRCRLILNADDEQVVAAAERSQTAGNRPAPVLWCSLDPQRPEIRRHLEEGGAACLLDDNTLVLARGDQRSEIARVEEVPICLEGAARHNVYNALTAVGLASAAGLPVKAISEGLRAIRGTAADNRGRGNFVRFGGVTALVDFAHNPHGVEALAHTVRQLPARRRLVLVGQAGDRDDEAIRALVRAAWEMEPDLVVIKEMESYLRGREPGVIPQIIEGELLRLGASPDRLLRAKSESEGVRRAIEWAEDGDLLILLIQKDAERTLALLENLADRGWRPGQSIP